MKRLIRKSEIYDAFNRNNKYYECFVNPNQSEIDSIKKEFNNCIRGVIYNDGTIYIWSGYILHNDINDNMEKEIDIEAFRFSYESNYWIFDANRNYSYQEMEDKILQYKNTLSKFGDINAKMYIYFTSELDFYDTNLNEIEKSMVNKL